MLLLEICSRQCKWLCTLLKGLDLGPCFWDPNLIAGALRLQEISLGCTPGSGRDCCNVYVAVEQRGYWFLARAGCKKA